MDFVGQWLSELRGLQKMPPSVTAGPPVTRGLFGLAARAKWARNVRARCSKRAVRATRMSWDTKCCMEPVPLTFTNEAKFRNWT